MLKRVTLNDGKVTATSFTTDNGAQEIFLAITTDNHEQFSAALTQVQQLYLSAAEQLAFTREDLVFGRVSLDSRERFTAFRQSPLFQELQHSALSLIVQPPMNSSMISVLVYCIKGDTVSKSEGADNGLGKKGSVLVRGENYSQLWLSNITGDAGTSLEEQTESAFNTSKKALGENGMTLLPNGLRTWVYVGDIDNKYTSMTEARKEWFAQEGLTDATRYLASTGVEGVSVEEGIGVTMDFMGTAGLQDEQIEKMEVLDNMPPTISYAVTFERGLKVRFGDRTHYHISGTASIDNQGNVIHLDDVAKQAERMVENVKALLKESGSAMDEMVYCIGYLRNPEDYPVVKDILEKHLPAQIPLIVVHGAICRPEWLVEIEGIAVKRDSHPFPPFL